jgi:hypothetical protein
MHLNLLELLFGEQIRAECHTGTLLKTGLSEVAANAHKEPNYYYYNLTSFN